MSDVWDALYAWEQVNDATIGDCSLCGNGGVYRMGGVAWRMYAFCDCHAGQTMPPALRLRLMATGRVAW